jgi:hypothetical protein
MGDDNKKSFWTSLPGILTGVAAVIAAVTGIVVAYNHGTPSPPSTSPSSTTPPPTSSSSTISPQPSSSSSTQQQSSCGAQLPGVPLFGSWRWSGTVHDVLESGVFTFKTDCTYSDVPKSGFTTNDEGQFLVNSSPASITLTNKASGEKHTYLISNISENSFHASNPDLTVNLDFFRAS